MSTIKDTYSKDDLFTEDQLSITPPVTSDDFETGQTYYVPEFVYQDIDEAKTKYYKLVEKTFDNKEDFGTKLVFASAILSGSVASTISGLEQRALANTVVLFKLKGVNFNGTTTIMLPIDKVSSKTVDSFTVKSNVNSINVQVTIPKPAGFDASDYSHYVKFDNTNSVYSVQVVGETVVFLVTIDTSLGSQTVNIIQRGFVATMKLDGVNFGGDTGSGAYTDYEAVPNLFGNDGVPYKIVFAEDALSLNVQLRLDKTNGVSFAGDYTLPAGIVLNGIVANEFAWFANVTITVSADHTFDITSQAVIPVAGNKVSFKRMFNFIDGNATGNGQLLNSDNLTYPTENVFASDVTSMTLVHRLSGASGPNNPVVNLNFQLRVPALGGTNFSDDYPHELTAPFVSFTRRSAVIVGGYWKAIYSATFDSNVMNATIRNVEALLW